MSPKTPSTALTGAVKHVLVPKLRFAEFRALEGWKVRQVGEVFKVTRGDVLSMTLVQDEKSVEASYPVYSSQTKNTGLSGYYSDFLYEDAITWTTDGANAGDVNYRAGKFYCTNVCGVLINTEGHANPCVAALINSVSKNYVSYVGNPKLMNGVMSKIAIPFPTVEEQQKIADCLSSLDELIATQARKVDSLKTHKKGLMQQLFPIEGETQPRLRFPEFRDVGEWEKKLGTVCDIQRGKFSHRPRNDPKFFGGKYPFIQTGDVVKSGGGSVIASQSLNEEGLTVSKLFKPMIVLITIAANIGDTGLLQTEGCFTDSVVELIPYKEVMPVFLELVMRGQKENLNKLATTGAQKNINNEILREVSVLLPSVPEQQRIAHCLASLDDLITAATQEVETLKTHKKGLMQQLFPSVAL